MKRIANLNDVVAWRLCLGCGACAYICPEHRVQLMDFLAEGIRPVVTATDCGSCHDCLDGCPAVQSDFPFSECQASGQFNAAFTKEWGPVVAMWEGHATAPDIRFAGSSGGVLTAIGAYCLEQLGMHGVLHTGQDPEDPIRNRTRLSQTRQELFAAAGSRYSPASICNGLGLVEAAPAPCAIIGRPSEIAAVRNACKVRPALAPKVGVTLSFFCAESPATLGTVALLKRMGVDPASVRNLRYRGFGWPGHFAPTCVGDAEPRQTMPYRESWAFLQAFRPWSVQLWPDSSGELADVSCGDPWYEEPDGKNPGFSLVVARTDLGRAIIEGAIRAGYLTLKPIEKWKLVKSQSRLIAKKGAVWGRRLALQFFALPVTRLNGLNLYHCWRQLSLKEKLRSTLGTFRRVLGRRFYRRMKFTQQDGAYVKAPLKDGKTP